MPTFETNTSKMKLVDILDEASSIASLNGTTGQVTSRPLALTNLTPKTRCVNTDRSAKEVTAHKGTKTLDKPTKKRTWKKPKDKPKRPLSAYNLFFQSERERIVHSGSPTGVVVPSNVEIKSGTKKRRHRKTHGKIGFADLARNIAQKWKNLDDEAKSPFEARAAVEKCRYKAELEAWNKTRESNERTKASLTERWQMQQQQQHVQLEDSNSVYPLAVPSCEMKGPSAAPLDVTQCISAPMPPPVLGKRTSHEDPHGMGKPANAMSLYECLAATQRTIEMATAVLNNPMLLENETSHPFGGSALHGMQQTLQSVQQTLGSISFPPTVSVSPANDAALDFPNFHPVEEQHETHPSGPSMSGDFDGASGFVPSSLKMDYQAHWTPVKLPTDKNSMSFLDGYDTTLDDDFANFLTEFET